MLVMLPILRACQQELLSRTRTELTVPKRKTACGLGRSQLLQSAPLAKTAGFPKLLLIAIVFPVAQGFQGDRRTVSSRDVQEMVS